MTFKIVKEKNELHLVIKLFSTFLPPTQKKFIIQDENIAFSCFNTMTLTS